MSGSVQETAPVRGPTGSCHSNPSPAANPNSRRHAPFPVILWTRCAELQIPLPAAHWRLRNGRQTTDSHSLVASAPPESLVVLARGEPELRNPARSHFRECHLCHARLGPFHHGPDPAPRCWARLVGFARQTGKPPIPTLLLVEKVQRDLEESACQALGAGPARELETGGP